MSRKLNALKQKNPIQTRISVESENEEKIQLLLYGDIGQYYSWSGISLDGVVSALAGKSADTIEVFINSYGGEIFEAIAIKNYLMRRPEKIIAYIDGIAASGASVIAMAGDEIIMPKDYIKAREVKLSTIQQYTGQHLEELKEYGKNHPKIVSKMECEVYLEEK